MKYLKYKSQLKAFIMRNILILIWVFNEIKLQFTQPSDGKSHWESIRLSDQKLQCDILRVSYNPTVRPEATMWYSACIL